MTIAKCSIFSPKFFTHFTQVHLTFHYFHTSFHTIRQAPRKKILRRLNAT
ncbi:hypothetical protein HanRHA438_Chr13g0614051 [Helianthus annuus]|nr:hypothetical protein HanRHA438_Chr13g0614051 [Helianthus annuus]